MASRNWKRLQPHSLRHGMELCLEYARETRRLSVDRVADLIGLANRWTLYKWLESGRLPAVLIRPFEHACGADYVTRYLAATAQRLLIEIPTGRRCDAADINGLQASFTTAVGLLIRFYEGTASAEDTLAALTDALNGLAWHRVNVAKAQAPELPLFTTEGEHA